MDTKTLMQWGLVVVGVVMALAIVVLGIIAWVHDGEVATTIVAELIDVMKWATGVIGTLLGVREIASAVVAIKQASAGATVAVAQATTTPATPDNGPTNG